ncbi:MAG: ABC transporter substrate-binding protein [Alphaproteobacteria bacterium]
MLLSRRTFLATPMILAALPATAQKSRNTLKAAFNRTVRTLDGNYSNWRESDILGLLTDDALYAVDPETGRAVPLAARGHRFVSPTTLDIELRDDVRFHDGSPMTPEDVVYTYTFLINEKSKNNYLTRFATWIERVEKTGPLTVRFHMKRPNVMALYDFAMYSKVRKAGVYDDASKPDGINAEAQTLQLNGSGPYRVTQFRPGQMLRLERVANYRAGGPKGSPAIQTIEFRVIPDWSTQVSEVISGGLHWTYGVPEEIAAGAAATGQVKLLSGPSMRTFYVGLDATGKAPGAAPLADKRVRQALNHATDREGIVRNLIKGNSRVLDTPCDTVQFGCDKSAAVHYAYDPTKARALLAEAGATDVAFEFWTERDRPLVEAILAQWNAVGVKSTMRFVQAANISQARRDGKIAAEFASAGSFGIPDAGAIIPDRLGPTGRNFTGDEELKKTVVAAVSTYDEAERKQHFSAAIRLATENAYWVPLWTDGQIFVMSPELEYTQPPDGMQRLYFARWR